MIYRADKTYWSMRTSCCRFLQNTSKVRGTESAMQHTRSEEASAYDSNRNMLNHDRSSLDKETLYRQETGESVWLTMRQTAVVVQEGKM